MQERCSVTYSEETITPYGFYVLVSRLPVESQGTILLPDNALNKNLYCEVKKVGHGEIIGSVHYPCPCKPGDVVIVRQMDGKKVTPLRGDLLLVHHEFVEAVGSSDPWPEEVLGEIEKRMS